MSVYIMNNYIGSRFNPRNPRINAQLFVLYAIIVLGFVILTPSFHSSIPATPPEATLFFSASGAGAGGAPPARGRRTDYESKNMDYTKTLQRRNPPLHNFLHKYTGGGVQTINEGQVFQYRVVIDKTGNRRIKRDGNSGEEYVIDCPVCGDSHRRCHVNHMFGVGIEGIPTYHLVHCHNENCDYELSKWLREAMGDGYRGSGAAPKAETRSTVPTPISTRSSLEPNTPLAMTIPTRLLSEVGVGHIAVAYVTGRGFDVKYLSDYFKVGLFIGNPYIYPTAKQRLIIPVYFIGSMVGWTARSVPGYTAKEWEDPKYMNAKGFSKKQFLYNYDQAKDAPVIAVAEGVTDVWKIGTWGMALFGKSMSDPQCQLLCQAGEGKGAAIVLLADASTEKDDAAKSWTQNYEKLKSSYKYPGRIFLHHMEKGDPGDYSPQELYDLVNNIVHGRKA